MRAIEDQHQSSARPLNRRTLLSSSAAALGSLALAGCGDAARPPQAPTLATDLALLNRPIVDVHAHIFVASDLPGHQFIVQSFLADHYDKLNDHARVVLHAFADAVTESAPNYKKELALLESGGTWEPKLEQVLATSFQKIANGDYRPKNLPPCMGGDPVAKPAEAQRSFRFLSRVLAPNKNDHSASEEIARYIAVALKDNEAAGRFIAAAIDSDWELLSNSLKWLQGFTKSRVQRVNDWSDFMGGHPNAPRFVMPALVDFGYSLERQDGPSTTFRQQVDLMAHLSRKQPPNRLMHGYVPFNPWRWARSESHEQRDSLELVKHAIHDCGFVGVKIYPPMGFQASGNQSIPYEQFKRGPADPNCDITKSFPKRVDEELSKLYAYCETNDIAIMLHSASSNAAAPDWGDRADPQFWWSVLEKHPKLRVDFGHFGGGFLLDKKPQGKQFIKTIVALMTHFPNVYADLSDYELVLHPGDEQERLFAAEIAHWSKVYGRKILRERLMFGTDWTFIARVPEHQTYPRALLLYMAEKIAIGGELTTSNRAMWEEAVANFAAGNACSFLGFNDPKGKALPRLLRFYGKSDPQHIDTLMTFVETARPGARRVAMRS